MARLGDFIHEECHPLGASGARHLRLIGVSNEHGLHPSSRDASDNLARYQRIERDWFAYNPMRVNVGSIGLADDKSKVGFTSPDYVVFSCRPSLEPAYLLHFLKSDYGLEAISNQSSGAVRKRLYFEGLAEIEVPIPPVDRQREVIRKLDEVKSAVRFICEENSDRHELPKLKQAILQEAITGRLTTGWRATNPKVEPANQLVARIRAEKARLVAAKKLRPGKPLPPIPAAEIPFEVPEGWEWCRLGSIAQHSLGKMLDAGKNRGSPKPYLRNLNVQWFNFLLNDIKQMPFEEHELDKYSVRKGDVLICEGGYPGQSAIWESDDPIMFQKALHRVRFIGGGYSPYLFVYYLKLSDNTGVLGRYYTGSGIQHLTGDSLHSLPIPLPPLAEQTEIVARVEGLMERCRELEAEIGHSRAHAQALLQAVLREAFAPAAATPAPRVTRPSIKPLAYFLQFLPALARAVGGTITLEELNRVAACLFMAKDELLPLVEKTAGADARDHFAGLDQAYEEGAFPAAVRALLKAKAFIAQPQAAENPVFTLSDNFPPIAPEIDADARYLAPLLQRLPENVVPRSPIRRKTPRVRETGFQLA